MSKTTIKYGRSVTLNLGNYESAKVKYSVERDVGDEEFRDAREAMVADVEDFIARRAEAVKTEWRMG